MKNGAINRGVIRTVAHALGEINERVVYVGGAVVSLYINDPAADDVRPTKDVDIGLEILTLGDLIKLREELEKKGFVQNTEDNVLCRFRYEDVTVDVMSTKAVGWAPSDTWFKPGFEHPEELTIEGGRVRILPLPYFLAAKFSAFHDRGGNDPRASHDFEDIIYILDNRTDVVENIVQSPDDVRNFMKSEFSKAVTSSEFSVSLTKVTQDKGGIL